MNILSKAFKLNNIIFILYSSCFCILIIYIPWFKYSFLANDLDIYTYIRLLDTNSYESDLSIKKPILTAILSEPIWAFIVVKANYLINSEFLFWYAIPFIILYLTVYYIYKKTKIVYTLFILHPIFIIYSLNQLRLAFAITIFFILLYRYRKIYLIYTIPLFLIHSSIAIFWSIFLLAELVLITKSSKYIKIMILILIGLIYSYFFGPGLKQILLLLGDWRANIYSNEQWQVSVLTSLYCLYFLFIISVNLSLQSKIIHIEQSVSMIILCMVIFSIFFVGGYPFRFLSASFPLLIISGFTFNKHLKFLYYMPLTIIGIYIGFIQLNWLSFLK